MIELRNISKSFESHKVLDDLTLHVKRGSTFVVIGRSGCGKSVLLKHIEGLLKPEAGEIFVDGKSILSMPDADMNSLRMKMGMVFQGGALFDSLTVGENVGFSLIEYSSLTKDQIHGRVEESLKLVGLSGIQELTPSELSGGMRKRVALARAICTNPDIILYDEPTTGVDPITADAINDLIRGLHDKLRVTSIVVTHDMKSAYKIADRIGMLYQGKLIAEGSPEEIQNSGNPFVHQFINGLAQGPITDDIKRTL
ncbi:MAG: ABC transporter ATP-binding protein [Candidatus Omnitrophica bacterium]|nr:ABC transporter ATP-binding protein [Candidatus Omnitrophota bacterium]